MFGLIKFIFNNASTGLSVTIISGNTASNIRSISFLLYFFLGVNVNTLCFVHNVSLNKKPEQPNGSIHASLYFNGFFVIQALNLSHRLYCLTSTIDPAGKFLNSYYETKIYEQDPFAKLDQTGVGQLVQMAAEKGKATRPNIKLGICGEHGGDPSSVEFCHKVGLTYVSCSPFRVPIARLAAAQAAIKENQK